MSREEASSLFQRALKLAAWPAVISLFVTLARFFSEREQLPSGVSMAIGIGWMTLVVGIYLGIRSADEESPYRLLVATLLTFSVLSRIPVVTMWWLTKTFGWGTHYDAYQSWGATLAAQFGLGVLQQVASGGVLGVLARYLTRRTKDVPA